MHHFFCESLLWFLVARQEVCAPTVCWPVGWEDVTALWAHKDTGIMLGGVIWMVPSCGTHADTLGKCWVCVPRRRVVSKCLGAALRETETSSQCSQSVAQILLQMSMRAKIVWVVFSCFPRPWLQVSWEVTVGMDIKTLSCKPGSTFSAAAQPVKLLDWEFWGEASNYPPIKLTPNLLNLILSWVSNVKHPRKQLAFNLFYRL